jgi:hypothetical protein
MYDAHELRRLAVVILSEPMAMGNNLLATVNNNKLKTRVGFIFMKSLFYIHETIQPKARSKVAV